MKLLLIDSRIKEYQIFIDSRKDDVEFFLFDYLIDTYNSVVNQLKLKGQQFTDIAVVQHADLIRGIHILSSETRCIASEESPYPSFDTFRDFLINLKNEVGLQRFDMLGCALYDPVLMPTLFSYLENATGVDLRASTNFTGNSPDGDWILESDNVDVRDTYFTEGIQSWTGVLYFVTDNTMWNSNKMIKDVNGNFIYLHKDIFGRPINKRYDASGFNVKFPPSGISGWGHVNDGGSNVPAGSNYVAICSTQYAMAALRENGTIRSWGNSGWGGTGSAGFSTISGVTDFVAIYSIDTGFAALKSDGSISCWGTIATTGGSAPVSTDSGYVHIYSTGRAFAALKSDGSIKTWGSNEWGGSGAPTDSGYVAIYSNAAAFAALKSNGTIYSWGSPDYIFSTDTTATYSTRSLSIPTCVAIYSTERAFAALKSDGSISVWGNSVYGGTGAPTDSGYVAIYSTHSAFAALKSDSSIRCWGYLHNNGGGSAPSSTEIGFVAIYSTHTAFAALKSDGSIKVWGHNDDGGNTARAPPGTGYVAIYSTEAAFAALHSNGTIKSWGNEGWGGNSAITPFSSLAPTDSGYIAIYSAQKAFAALKSDGSIKSWGDTGRGGSGAPTGSGYISVYSSESAFSALKPVSSFTMTNYRSTTGASTTIDAPSLTATGISGGITITINRTIPDTTYIINNTFTCNGVQFATPLNTHTFNGLTNGTSYTISVKSTNLYGDSSLSYITSMPFTIPGEPTLSSILEGNGQLTINFTAPLSNGGSPITGYKLSVNGVSETLGIITSPYIKTGLTNGTSYTIVLVAINARGDSGTSNILTGIPYTVPGAPTLNSITSGNAQAIINFTVPSSNGGSAITGYKLSVNNGGSYETLGIITSPYTKTGLINGTLYTILLIATNARGDSVASNSSTVTPFTTPSAPTIGTVTPGNTQAIINFTVPSSNGGSPITGYKLSLNGVSETLGVITSPYIKTGLTNGTSYTLLLIATNARGDSVASNSSIVTPRTVPGTPTLNSITAGAGNWQVIVNFTAPATNGGNTITQYRAISDVAGLSGLITSGLPALGGASNITVSGLVNNTSYTFYVIAMNDAGSSSNSSIIRFIPMPATPTITDILKTTLKVNWTSIANTTSYTLQQSSDNNTFTDVSSGIVSTTYNISGLSQQTTYYYRVIAKNGAISSSPSLSISVTTATFNTYSYYRFITNHLLGKGALVDIRSLYLYSKTSIYPPREFVEADISTNSITDFCGNITGQPYGNGRYIIKSSTTGYNQLPWYVFDNSTGTAWLSVEGPTIYSDTDGGSTTGTNSSKTLIEGQNISGEWIQLQLPSEIELTSFKLVCNGLRIPDGMIIVGSNDGIAWKYMHRALYGINPITYTPVSGNLESTIVLSIPSTPAAPTITNVTQTTLTVNWVSVLHAASYTLQQSSDNNTFTDVSSGIVSTTYNVTGLSPQTLYYYKVIATNGLGSSIPSSATTLIPIPGTPAVPTITNIGPTTLTVNWTSVSYATSYTLQESTNNTTFNTVSTGIVSTTYNITGLLSLRTYYYRVIATNSSGSSTASSSILGTTITPIVGITNITTTSQMVSWSPVFNAISYTLQQSLDNTTFTQLISGLSETSYTVSGLSIDTTYYYRVVIQFASSTNTTSSSQRKLVTPFVIQSSNNAIIIKWSHVTTPSSATNYYIYQNDVSYNNIMPIDILPKLNYQSMIITDDMINGYYAYYSVQPYFSTTPGTQTSKYLMKALSVYDDIQYTNLKLLTPALLTNCIAWYDSADPTTISLDWGGSILNIKNKINPSLYQLDSSMNSTSSRPFYKNGYVGTFYGYDNAYIYSTDYYKGTYFNCVSGSFFTANGLKLDRTTDSTGSCVVGIVYTSRNVGLCGLWGTYGGNGRHRYQFINSTFSGIENGSATISVGTSLNTTNQPIIYTAALTSNSTSVVRVNGVTQLNFTETYTSAGANLQINAVGNNTNVGAIMVHEIVILKGPQWNMTDVYQLEGYFGHKWGITDRLPNNHPYKLAKPYDTTILQAEEQRLTNDTFVPFML